MTYISLPAVKERLLLVVFNLDGHFVLPQYASPLLVSVFPFDITAIFTSIIDRHLYLTLAFACVEHE